MHKTRLCVLNLPISVCFVWLLVGTSRELYLVIFLCLRMCEQFSCHYFPFTVCPPTPIENVRIPWEGYWMIQWLLQFLNKMVSSLYQHFNLAFSKRVNFSLRKLTFVRVWTIKWPPGIVFFSNLQPLFCH